MKHFLHHFLFPRESNNHRAKLLHHDSLLVIVCLFLFFTSLFSAVHRTFPQVLGIASDISAGELLTLTNEKRQENGLKALKMNSQLTQAASQKAHHMFANNYWAHIAPDGTTPWYFIKDSGYEYLYAGENLARGFTTAKAVIDAWMASPTHRENMLSPNYNEIGFAIESGTLTGTETILVVEEMGSRYVDDSDTQGTQTQASSPTPAPLLGTSPAPSPSVFLTVTPSPTTLSPKLEEQHPAGVAAVTNQPLFDSQSLSRTVSFVLLFVLLAVLIIDAIMIEKRKIARVVGHNIDHVIFLVIILIVIIIVGRGLIL